MICDGFPYAIKHHNTQTRLFDYSPGCDHVGLFIPCVSPNTNSTTETFLGTRSVSRFIAMRNNISNIVGSYQFAFKGNEYCMMGGNLASRCLPRTIPDQITVKRRLRLKGLVASASGLLNPDRIQIEQLYIKHRGVVSIAFEGNEHCI